MKDKLKKYSREELLTPKLRKLASKYRKELKEWKEKCPITEETKRKIRAILDSVDTGYKGPLENISGNFREYIYNSYNRFETKSEPDEKD